MDELHPDAIDKPSQAALSRRTALRGVGVGGVAALLLTAGLERSAARLRALSPVATLDRGYAIVRREGAVVSSAAALGSGDEIDVRLAEGGFSGTVGEVRP